MSLSAAGVVAASNAWVWVPEDATTEATPEYLLARFPDYFDHPLELLRFSPAETSEAALAAAVETVLERGRQFGQPDLYWWVRPDSPPEIVGLLLARGATVDVALDVLAIDLRQGQPELPPPVKEVTLRWATDVATYRDGIGVGVASFGLSMPPEERLAEDAKREGAAVTAGDGGMVVAYVDGAPVGSGAVTMADGAARLWFASVVESARGQGVYRALLAARLAYGAARGATMGLVKGRVSTSGPILRRAGFNAYGHEIMYRVPLA
jgi:GNAT superfamily N-acetyltransferase